MKLTIVDDLLHVDNNSVFLGDHIGMWNDDTDEQTNLPFTLVNGDVISDDAELHELEHELNKLGFSTTTDDEGVVLAQRRVSGRW